MPNKVCYAIGCGSVHLLNPICNPETCPDVLRFLGRDPSQAMAMPIQESVFRDQNYRLAKRKRKK